MNGGKRKSSNSTVSGSLQIRQNCFAVLICINHNILHGCAESDLDGNGVAVLSTNQAGQRAVNIPQGAPLGFLHDHFDRLVVAVEIPLHSTEDFRLGADGIQLRDDLPLLLCQFIPLFQAGILAEGITGNGIISGGDIVLRRSQFLTAGGQVGLCLMVSGCAGRKVTA